MPYIKVEPVLDLEVREWCRLPYPRHPKGCPNYGRIGCPPSSPMLDETLELDSSVYAIYNIFDFVGHCERMRSAHPEWSEAQVRCLLYWQGTARKHLRKKVSDFLTIFPKCVIVGSPEAYGVDVTKTMEAVEVELEWPPETVTYQIALAGRPG